MSDQIRKTTPPTDDVRLRRYFCEAESELGFSAAFIGERGASTAPKTDDKLVNRGIVRLAHDLKGESSARSHRETRAMLQKLTTQQVTVLFLAYGPEAAVPGLSLPDDPQARARLGSHLGQWRNVLMVTDSVQDGFRWSNAIRMRGLLAQQAIDSDRRREKAAALFAEADALKANANQTRGNALQVYRSEQDAARVMWDEARAVNDKAKKARRDAERTVTFAGHDTIDEREVDIGDVCRWLIHGAPVWLIKDARKEAAALVFDAWNAWADIRGRRPPRPRHERLEREAD